MKHLSRVFQMDGNKWTPNAESIYGDHLYSILKELSIAWGPRYDEFDFLIYQHQVYSQMPAFCRTGNNVILIFLSDEEGKIPSDICSSFFAILKTYWPIEERRANIISFPIGYSNSSKHLSFIPFEKRMFDVGYAGNFFPNRLDFFRQFSNLKHFPPFPLPTLLLKRIYWHVLTRLIRFKPCDYNEWIPNSRIHFSSGFAKGLPRDEYARIISNSRIALCPKGFISTECFRLFETMSLGCVIIASELPPTFWFKGSPIIIQKNWLNIKQTVQNLLADPMHLTTLHNQTLTWWKDVCSDSAAAAHLVKELNQIYDLFEL